MRPFKHAEEAREATPGAKTLNPGVMLPTPYAPARQREFERGNGPLDTPKPPPRRQVGRRIFEHGE